MPKMSPVIKTSPKNLFLGVVFGAVRKRLVRRPQPGMGGRGRGEKGREFEGGEIFFIFFSFFFF